MRDLKPTGIAGLPLLLAACAIVPAPSGSTAGRLDVKRAVMIVSENVNSPSTQSAENSVRRLLSLQGYTIKPKADVGVIVGFAERSPSLIFESNPAGGDSETQSTVRANQRPTRINLCADRVYRLTVAFVDQRSGKVAYRGFSEQESCDPPNDATLNTMAAGAMRSIRRFD